MIKRFVEPVSGELKYGQDAIYVLVRCDARKMYTDRVRQLWRTKFSLPYSYNILK